MDVDHDSQKPTTTDGRQPYDPEPHARVNELDGVWKVERAGGLLPPLLGVRKHIAGDRGETRVGRLLRAPFRVEGLVLRYLPPFGAFVDVLEPGGDRLHGRATFRGREFGRFVMTRLKPKPTGQARSPLE